MKKHITFLFFFSLTIFVCFFSVNAQTDNIDLSEEYDPHYKPSDFTIDIDNPYFSLPIGKKMVYQSETEDGLERIEILIPGWTRVVNGVETLVFWDRVYLGNELIEDTRDYVAQHKQTGDVWYFGEHVDNYENGKIADHDGAWLSGVDQAKPGIWALAKPEVGSIYKNEHLKGEAEDESLVESINEGVSVLFGDFEDCVKNLDGSPLFKGKEYRYDCKDQGVNGTVLEIGMPNYPVMSDMERVELVDVDLNGARGIELPIAYAKEGVISKFENVNKKKINKEDADKKERDDNEWFVDEKDEKEEDGDEYMIILFLFVGVLAGALIQRYIISRYIKEKK
jgi:hypothetical protein